MANPKPEQDVSELDAPTVLEPEPVGAASGDEVAPEPKINEAETRDKIESVLRKTQRALAAQPKVTVRVQEDTYVAINGWGFRIKAKTKVQVPEQVADILEEAGRI